MWLITYKILPFHFLASSFFRFLEGRTTPSYTQNLLLALCTNIIPSKAQEPFIMLEIKLSRLHAKQTPSMVHHHFESPHHFVVLMSPFIYIFLLTNCYSCFSFFCQVDLTSFCFIVLSLTLCGKWTYFHIFFIKIFPLQNLNTPKSQINFIGMNWQAKHE